MSGPVSTPRVLAKAGHTLRHSNTSPLVMLNASFAAWGDCAAQTITSATRSASAAYTKQLTLPGLLQLFERPRLPQQILRLRVVSKKLVNQLRRNRHIVCHVSLLPKGKLTETS